MIIICRTMNIIEWITPVHRFDRSRGVGSCAVGGQQWSGLRHVGHSWNQVPSDPADAPRRQTGWHLAPARLRRLHPSPGDWLFYSRARWGHDESDSRTNHGFIFIYLFFFFCVSQVWLGSFDALLRFIVGTRRTKETRNEMKWFNKNFNFGPISTLNRWTK